MKKGLDKNTAKQLREADELKQLCKSDGWAIAKGKILEKILELSSILNITEQDPQKVVVLMAAKQEAVQILTEWLGEIEGIAGSADDMNKAFVEQQKNHYIKILNDSPED